MLHDHRLAVIYVVWNRPGNEAGIAPAIFAVESVTMAGPLSTPAASGERQAA